MQSLSNETRPVNLPRRFVHAPCGAAYSLAQNTDIIKTAIVRSGDKFIPLGSSFASVKKIAILKKEIQITAAASNLRAKNYKKFLENQKINKK